MCNFQCKYYKGSCTANGWGRSCACALTSRGGQCSLLNNKDISKCSICSNWGCLERKGINTKKDEKEELPFDIDTNEAISREPAANEEKIAAVKEEKPIKVFSISDTDEVLEDPFKGTSKPVGKTFDLDTATAYVDGSFNNKSQTYGYGVVLMYKNEQLEYSGCGNNKETAKIRNVAGELIGAMTAMKKAKDLGATKLIICYDYEGIEKWATGAWKCNNDYTKGYKEYANNCGIEVNFKKIKAHSGECFNEMADKLAKKAAGVA